MATVPIEIVLQDAETPVDPTPTPESGEETNIVVPNTGTISNDGDSNGGIGSTASIILPAIIAVLALCAMVALLVHRQQKRKKANDNTEECSTKLSKKEKLATSTSGTIAILAATVLVGNLVIPATKAATNVEPGTAELETEDKITIIATREQDSDTITATVKNTSYATANLDFGYKVTASMAEGLTTASLYLDGDEASEYYIAPAEDGVLANNTWGYTLDEPSEDATYLHMPLTNDPTTIVKGSGEIEDEAVDIYYTIKVDKSLPTGTYTGELEYTITPAVEYMQDFATMTEEEKTATLANMPEGQQYILKDIRDKKPYYISKLADGNVWMTQNLDHDIAAGKLYDSTNTDLPFDTTWIPSSDEATYATDNISWKWSATSPESYDPSNLYWDGTLNTNNDGNLDNETVMDPSETTGGTHYHMGNYYNWTAAVAMSDSSSYTTQHQGVNQSICPAGWRLPTYNGSKSYQDLVDTESLTAGISGNIQTHPTFFIYNGYWGGKSFYPGSQGHYWSSIIEGETGATQLEFSYDNNLVTPSVYGSRDTGFSVRCVAR